jgi:sugar phosphate permease
VNGGTASLEVAAMQSVGFDVAGAVGILAMGAGYTALGPKRGLWLILASLVLLAPAIFLLPWVGSRPLFAAALLAIIGFLLYGPFSLLGGLLSLDAGGPRLAATAAGLTDGVGYVASALAGVGLGRLLDKGGYSLAFSILAALALVAALVASRLRLKNLATGT